MVHEGNDWCPLKPRQLKNSSIKIKFRLIWTINELPGEPNPK